MTVWDLGEMPLKLGLLVCGVIGELILLKYKGGKWTGMSAVSLRMEEDFYLCLRWLWWLVFMPTWHSPEFGVGLSRLGFPVIISLGDNLDYLSWCGKVLLLWVAPFLGQGILDCVRVKKEQGPACLHPCSLLLQIWCNQLPQALLLWLPDTINCNVHLWAWINT